MTQRRRRWLPLADCICSSVFIFVSPFLCAFQCDQMVRLFFNFWPFTTMKISPIMSQIYQSNLSILPYKKLTVKNLPKWRNFAKSGHTELPFLRAFASLLLHPSLSKVSVAFKKPKVLARNFHRIELLLQINI